MITPEQQAKIKELVEWVAVRAFNLQSSPEIGWSMVDEVAKTHYRTLARICLSHPDLALIESDQLTVDMAIKAGYIIPLAELKEVEE